MKIAYFDCVGGASGDMLLGALVDCGVSEEKVGGVISALQLPGCEIRFEKVMKGALSATQATVTTPQKPEHRHLPELLEILHNSSLPPDIQNKTEGILRRIAQVEANIHNEEVEGVHLHELGGDDTLIDIASFLCGLAELQADHVCVSPLPLARGLIQSAHGLIPLPAPATLALLTGVPVRYVEGVEKELVTPTGAALLTGVAGSFGGFPEMTLIKTGCGAGQRDLPFPNVVRLWLGETQAEPRLITEKLYLLETNIDDMNPQIFGHVMERLFSAGALDVTLTPMQMKKNRPAVLLSVLCHPEAVQTMTRILFEETTTLGVRRQVLERVCLPRAFETVQTPYGPIRVKVARWDEIEHRTPEYEDCRLAAEKHSVPISAVILAAQKGSPS